MQIRPAAALTGALLGVSALFLPTAAQAAAGTSHHHPSTVAHRGASAYAPENTLAAVDAADDLGVDWVENDVQRTRDGELIIMHDTTLTRTTDVEQVFPDRAPWKISDFTLDEIEKLDAGSWFGPKFAGEPVPTLEEYLDRVSDNHQKLLMEIKAPELYPGIERQTLRELRREGWLDRKHLKRLIVQSFSADSVRTRPPAAAGRQDRFPGHPARRRSAAVRGVRRPDQPEPHDDRRRVREGDPGGEGCARPSAGGLHLDGETTARARSGSPGWAWTGSSPTSPMWCGTRWTTPADARRA